jgi:CRP-like cAMP-binding protein
MNYLKTIGYMATIEFLKQTLYHAAHINEEQFSLAEKSFSRVDIKKGDTTSLETGYGKDLNFIVKGLFRSYYIEPKTGNEINVFFFQEGEFMISLLVFNAEMPCNYYVEALEDAVVFTMSGEDLKKLYKVSHQWEHFGRIIAESYYRGSNARAESFIFNTPEERYLQLIKSFPTIFQRTSLLNISSYMGVKSQSLSRIRKRISKIKK